MTFPKLPNNITLILLGLIVAIIETYFPNNEIAYLVAGGIMAVMKLIQVQTTPPTVPVDEVQQAAARSGMAGAPIVAPGSMFRWFFD